MRSNLPTEKKLNTLVKKSVDLKPLQILGWKGIKSKNTAILTLKYPSWEQKVRRPRVKKSGDKKSGKTSNLQGKLVFVQKWGRRTFSMEIGWFWGEIRVLWWRQLINTAVGHYLWGIDTTSEVRVIFSDLMGRTLPMRNWYKQQTYELHFCSPWGGRTLPMRNWYIHQQFWFQFPCSESRTLPMRNWYLLPLVQQLLLVPVGHYLWGIDTVAPSGNVPPVTWATSDITYEELILPIKIFHEKNLNVCRTLPMRNWYHLRV